VSVGEGAQRLTDGAGRAGFAEDGGYGTVTDDSAAGDLGDKGVDLGGKTNRTTFNFYTFLDLWRHLLSSRRVFHGFSPWSAAK
jgi:hypothetical protein